MIQGITNDKDGRVIQRLSVSTKVAIGLPPQGDRNYPTKIDHFVFLRKPADSKKGNLWEVDPKLTEHYKANPREVEIILLDDDLDNVFPTKLAWWLQSQCRCWGDGQVATRRTEKHPEGEEWNPCGVTCKDLQAGRCKSSGDLRFMLADFPQLGSVARIHTSSNRSIQQIHSALQQIQLITGGRLAGIRAKLVVRPEKTSYADKENQDQRKSTTIYALSIEIQAAGMKSLVDRMTETARLFQQTRKALGTSRIEVVEPEEEIASEIHQEFYPVAEDKPEAVTGEVVGETKAEAEPERTSGDEPITNDERRRLYQLASNANVTMSDLKMWLTEQHNVTTDKITQSIANDCATWLKSVADNKEVASAS